MSKITVRLSQLLENSERFDDWLENLRDKFIDEIWMPATHEEGQGRPYRLWDPDWFDYVAEAMGGKVLEITYSQYKSHIVDSVFIEIDEEIFSMFVLKYMS